jgi:hypothetical protein
MEGENQRLIKRAILSPQINTLLKIGLLKRKGKILEWEHE